MLNIELLPLSKALSAEDILSPLEDSSVAQ